MQNIDYSVAIRTLGKSGEKYKKLLYSIRFSRIQPREVIIVLPSQYEPPAERLGFEQFVYTEKSMIGQRLKALEYITAPYTLFLDDDIEYGPDFVEQLLEPLMQGKYDCSTGPLFSFFPASIPGQIAGFLTASVCWSFFHKDMYVKILRSGGWSYHIFDTQEKRFYPTESFAWTCFMIRTEVMKMIHMEDEKQWLERFGYACGDDRVMAYKLIKCGYKACIVSNAIYIHNDAKTSTSADEMDKFKPKFCMYYMHTVFWKRFIQEQEKNNLYKIVNLIWYLYWKNSMKGYYLLKTLNKGKREYAQAFYAGVKEGERYVRSKEYQQLPDVIRRD